MKTTLLKNLILVVAVQGLFAASAWASNEGLRISCTEKLDDVEREDSMAFDTIAAGKLLQIAEDGGTYRLKTGTVENGGLKDALFGGRLSECSVSAANAESFPPQYFLMDADCMGDDRAKDGPLTEISIDREGESFVVKTKTTTNVFGQISVDTKVDKFQHCSIDYRD